MTDLQQFLCVLWQHATVVGNADFLYYDLDLNFDTRCSYKMCITYWPTCNSFSVSSNSMLQMSGMLVFSAMYFCWDVVLPASAHNALAPCSFTDTLKFCRVWRENNVDVQITKVWLICLAVYFQFNKITWWSWSILDYRYIDLLQKESSIKKKIG